ncbi:FMN-binding protein [Paenibacillus sp. YN15]|uniref:FMN-binding protein n=1 Tax=Paenibacillus sp. YN15 TaxID=1742774 RepID=UPI000DCC8CE2|nr:FMN-binding protein [Paenibacillus sp. YN15]RAV04698.1 FMN-binding protein [Paenibacillus sp. YN15]
MKKTAAIILSLSLTAALAAGCGGSKSGESSSPSASPASSAPAASAGQYADGVYYAQADEFDASSGWKEAVGLKVEGGKIVSVNWTGLNKDGGIDKKQYSLDGRYGMKAKGKASAEWHEQAAKAEKFLIEKQDPAAIKYNAEGKTDAISGVSVHVNGLATLADKALKAGPVKAGTYKDGTYKAEGEFDASSGWKDIVTVTVLDGKIFAVEWNGVHKDGGTDKKTRSRSGQYGMKAGGASSEWHEQAYKAEQYLLEKQAPDAIKVASDGKTDAISGVSIHVNGFTDLAKKALNQAK